MPSLPLDDENRPLFTVGQVADMLEIQQAFLRRLDEFRVVQPSRSAGGQRRYSRREITVVQYVTNLVDEGMTLKAIRRVLELESRVRELEYQVRDLEAHRDAAVAERDALVARLSPRPE
jgi:MerR family transcriptional regulator/heat shock protein HspR